MSGREQVGGWAGIVPSLVTNHRVDTLQSWILVACSALLSTPLYFVTTRDGVAFAPLLALDGQITPVGFGIPLGIVSLPALGGLWLLRAQRGQLRLRGRGFMLPICALVVWMTAVGIYGVAISERSLLTASLCLQTILPLLTLLGFVTLPVSKSTAKRTIQMIPLVGSASIVLLLMTTGYLTISRPPTLRAFAHLTEAFYSAKNIHPVVVAAGLAVLLTQFSVRRPAWPRMTVWFLLLIHVAYLVIIWSRAGFLMIGTLVLLWLVREVRTGMLTRQAGSGFWLERFGVIAVATFFGVISLSVGGLSARGVAQSLPTTDLPGVFQSDHQIAATPDASSPTGKPTAEDDDGDLLSPPATRPSAQRPEGLSPESRRVAEMRSGNDRRLRLLRGGISRAARSPVVGVAFNPLPPGSEVFGKTERDHKLYPSHNQYVDIAVRAGVPALILFVASLLSIGRSLWRQAAASEAGSVEGELAASAIFLFVAAALASMFQAYFVVTQPAVLLYLVAGMTLHHALETT